MAKEMKESAGIEDSQIVEPQPESEEESSDDENFVQVQWKVS